MIDDHEIVVEADDVYAAMALVPVAVQARYGRPVPFTVIHIDPEQHVGLERGRTRVTALARP